MISITELVFGILTISPAEYAGPDPRAVVEDVVTLDEPESPVQPATRANRKRNRATIEIFLMV
jgi:hypothetical protein